MMYVPIMMHSWSFIGLILVIYMSNPSMVRVQGTFLIRHGMSQTATLIMSLVSEGGSIVHSCLDSQQLAALPLQVPPLLRNKC